MEPHLLEPDMEPPESSMSLFCWPPEESATPENFVETFVENLEREVEERSQKRYVGPALSNIAGVPLATLAELARSLVSVQNLAQNIRGELQTVGGDIDVATITLNEGFRWVSHA